MNELPGLSRRTALCRMGAIAASAAVCVQPLGFASEPVARTGMGLVIYDCNIRRRSMRKQQPGFELFEPLTFLKHCHSLGAGGMQTTLGVLAASEIEKLREFAASNHMFIDAIIRPPQDASDVSRFEAEVKTARHVGVQAARTTIIPGRRYERFKTLREFREFAARGQQMLELAAPIVEKQRVPLAVENHKDQRIDERIALFKHFDSEFIGACVDTGNSFALLDGAYEPIEALAPYALSVHLKDQALQAYEEGFLLSDIPLGQGSFEMKRMVEIIRKAKPNVKFSLELITREALKVPCFTQEYYATMPHVRANELARTMRFVAQHTIQELPQVSTLPPQQQVQLEDANVMASIRYASKELQL